MLAPMGLLRSISNTPRNTLEVYPNVKFRLTPFEDRSPCTRHSKGQSLVLHCSIALNLEHDDRLDEYEGYANSELTDSYFLEKV